jgi:hypothetical protein
MGIGDVVLNEELGANRGPRASKLLSTIYPLLNRSERSASRHSIRSICSRTPHLAAVERKARELDCCKVTLEVPENNAKARHTYERSGFTQALDGPTTGGSLYYWKTL